MIYDLSKDIDVKNLITKYPQHFDFIELIDCINSNINKNLKVDLRFDSASEGLLVETGTIKSAFYESKNNDDTLSLTLNTDGGIIEHSFPVLVEKIEHNNNSDNITFVKTYIEDINFKVIVGFIFSLS